MVEMLDFQHTTTRAADLVVRLAGMLSIGVHMLFL